MNASELGRKLLPTYNKVMRPDELGRKLLSACNKDDVIDIRRALADGASPTWANDDGWGPLHWVRSPEAATLLIEAGANPNATDLGGYSALHAAAINGSVDICLLLIGAGANIEVRTPTIPTPLALAARNGLGATCAALILAGANTDDFVDFCTRNNHMSSLDAGQAAMRELAMAAKINGVITPPPFPTPHAPKRRATPL